MTSKDAARLLGVSEASVKRWADAGLLPAEKTAGGHRRFRPDDLALFRRGGLKSARQQQRLPRAQGAGETSRPAPDAAAGARRSARAHVHARAGASVSHTAPDDETLAAEMYESLVGGRNEEAAATVVRLHLEGRRVAGLFDGVLAPALRRVGDLWHQGVLTVAQEHVATAAAAAALAALRGVLAGAPRGAGPSALCCSTEEDFHALPVQAASLLLEEAGWEVIELGPSTPFYSLAEAVRRFRPRLVCVASTMLPDLERAAREYGELRGAAARAGASVVLGGAGFADERVRRRFPAELYADDFAQLEEFVARLSTPAGADGADAVVTA